MAAENALGFLRMLAQDRAPARIVLITGPQSFLREYVLETLRQRVARDGFKYRAFQVSGGDGFAGVVNELEGGDLFAPKRLVVCRVLRSYRERGGGTDGEDGDASEIRPGSDSGGDGALGAAIERIRPAVYFALLYERDNAPAKMRRMVEKAGVVINCPRPFDNQLGQYVDLFARNLGLKLSLSAADLLIGRHGGDLAAITNALAKASISCGKNGKVEASDLGEAGSTRTPDLFELAESLARGHAGETLALFDRAIQVGRDPIELLAVELIPLIRRMLLAASVMARRKGVAEVASALGLPPSSPLVTRAVDGARRCGLKRLTRAHQRACALDANFKMGLVKEREHAIAGMLIELMADGDQAPAD
jgi:DNA polymerase III subunit delta